ncbi:kelch-like protein 38 [Cydia fagiglandana]|uniref:kelch-like protein 38 n=1 Tax=Cydia fagiglandana TaxID=1458189 RepID=UPI002FEE23D7
MSSKLYEDKDFTDFYLCAGDGKIAVHKNFLVAHSDVFKAMLSGPWKEAEEGKVNMEGVTINVLERLKSYMYKGDVFFDDDEEIQTLLLLARYYLIEDLQKQCIRILAETVKPEKLFSLIEFACQHQIPELPFAMLQMTQDSVVNEAFSIKSSAEF